MTFSDPKQWLVTTTSGDLLVTLYGTDSIEVAPRSGPSSWGPPLPVKAVQS